LALAKSSVNLAKIAIKGSNRVPKKRQLLDKYGHLAWALITDCKDNEEYCTFLANNGFNLILMGDYADIQKVRQQVEAIDANLLIEVITVNWTEVETDL
jgi:hypothetical protein